MIKIFFFSFSKIKFRSLNFRKNCGLKVQLNVIIRWVGVINGLLRLAVRLREESQDPSRARIICRSALRGTITKKTDKIWENVPPPHRIFQTFLNFRLLSKMLTPPLGSISDIFEFDNILMAGDPLD